MGAWALQESADGLRLEAATLRAYGSSAFTWAHLLYPKLAGVRVFVLYFPSRFDLDEDATAMTALRAFGKNTGAETSVNVWDGKDPEWTHALELFGLKRGPALVLCSGLQLANAEPFGPDRANLYTISFTEAEVLGNKEQLAAAVNAAHDVLIGCNPKEIAGYLRSQKVHEILAAVAKVSANVRDALLKLKPSLGLPGGVSIKLG